MPLAIPRIVDKEETNDVISWSQDGESFFGAYRRDCVALAG